MATVQSSNVSDCISEMNSVSHRLVSGEMAVEENWLPTDRPARIGVTSGASTPDAYVQEALERLVLLKSVISTDAAPAAAPPAKWAWSGPVF